MIWNLIGILAALGVAAAAWRQSRRPGGFYDAQVYAMNAVTHRRYAYVSLAFAACFAVAMVARADTLGIIALAAYTAIAVIYASSFLRGASDYHE